MRERVVLVAFLLGSGCGSASRSLPEASAIDATLAMPPAETITREASEHHEPRLRPVRVDLADGMSPDEAALIAVAHNPELRAARARRGVAAGDIVRAGILPNPQLAGSLEFPTDGQTTGTTPAYSVELSYEISALIGRSASVRAARLDAEAVDLDVAWQEWQAAQLARLHALQLVMLERRIEAAREAESALDEEVHLLAPAVEAGDATALALSAARTARDEARLARQKVEQARRRAQIDLTEALGVSPATEVVMDRGAALPSWDPPPDLGSLLGGLEDRRLDLRALRRGYASQDARVRAAVLQGFPPVSVGVLRARDTGAVGTWGVTVSIDIPLLDRNQGEVRVDRATREQLRDEYVSRVHTARSDVARILADLVSTQEQLQTLQASVPELEALVTMATDASARGDIPIVEVFDLRLRLLQTRLSILELQQTVLELGVGLDVAAGTYREAGGGT